MARAIRHKWFRFVAGLAVGVAGPTLGAWATPQEPAPADAAPRPLVVPAGKASQAHVALNNAVEAMHRGDYAAAETFFHQAEERQADLNPTECADLARLMSENARDLAAQRAGSAQLRLAEKALADGHNPEARDLLARLSSNEQFLTKADRERFRQLSGRVNGPSQASPVDAQAKLRQARAVLARYDFDAAEALANEAAHVNAPAPPGGDTPQAVLQDIAKAKADPKIMLAAGRAALRAGQLDRAEAYAQVSLKTSSTFTFGVFSSDTPKKLLEDVKTARAQLPRKPEGLANATPPASRSVMQTSLKPDASTQTTGPVLPAAPGMATSAPVASTPDAPAPVMAPVVAAPVAAAPVAGDDDTNKARRLLAEARVALASKDFTHAKLLAEKARLLQPKLAVGEDTPEKVLTAVALASQPVRDAQMVAEGGSRAQALVLLKQGRDLLAHNQLEEATQVANKARAIPNLHWGLFDDTPDKLFQDVEKARVQRDQEESIKVLAEARKAYEAGDLDKASLGAYKARKLHGPYTIMDLGDRPDKLLVDIETARARVRRTQATQTADAGSDARANDARRLLADARTALKAGDTQRAQQLALQVQQMHAVLNRPNDDTPEAVLRDVTVVRANPTAVSTGMLLTPQAGPPSAAARVQADRLLTQARTLQRQGNFAEAYARALDAQKLAAVYQPNEDNPTVACQQIMAQARAKFEGLLRGADDLSLPGVDAAHGQQAEGKLQQARQLALAFHQDTKPVDMRLTRLQELRTAAVQPAPAGPGGPSLPVAPPPVAQAPQSPNQLLLDKARLELNHGQVTNARNICIEVLSSSDPSCREQAEAVLRSVDAEENNQRTLEACRAFDAALQACNRRDFANAQGILGTIDPRLLDPGRQARLATLLQQPDMKPQQPEAVQTVAAGDPVPTPGAPTGDPKPVLPVPPAPSTLQAGTGDAPGHGTASDENLHDATIARYAALRDIHFQEMHIKGNKVMALATEKFKVGQIDAAIDALKTWNQEVLDDTQLDPAKMSMLRRPVEARIKSFEIAREQAVALQHDPNTLARLKHQQIQDGFNAEQLKQKKVAELMKQYTTLYKGAKYEEAEKVAMLAKEVDPDNAIVEAALLMARRAYRRDEIKADKADKERYNYEALKDAEKPGDPRAIRDPIQYPRDPKDKARLGGHKPITSISVNRKSDKEREIESKLYAPVSMNFTDRPLREAIDQLAAWNNINIYIDTPALEEEGIILERPVSLRLDQVSMKAALTLLLHQAKLTWIIKDEVLQVTTLRAAAGKLEQRTYEVADLVIPLPEFGNINKPRQPVLDPSPSLPYSGVMPVQGLQDLQGGTSVGSPGGYRSGSDVSSNGQVKVTTNGTGDTREADLIKLITSTIQPSSWAEMGGPGTINYHPPTHGLVVNQTGDIQEQIQDLLAALRRLQDQEVSVEVRFISISEDFYERIGVSFNMDIQTPNNTRFQPILLSGQYGQPGFLNTFSPSHFISGLVNPGQLSPDLGIPITNTSFAQNIPQFGGYAPGLMTGIAFLSDIQVYLFMEAAQGDTRTNIMQAPKLTLFNGQTATLQVSDAQNFVTSVNLVPGVNGSVIFVPTSQPIPNQTSLTIQAVISADRRFVRLDLNPTLTNLAPGPVGLFPIVVPFFPPSGITPENNPILFTQQIQQPIVDTITVETSVAVPDGGTVVLGGLKRLSEERSESGPPIVSKIPYLSRLFKNTAYGRETESLLIMVTPRIIIQEEEEIRQTGFIANP